MKTNINFLSLQANFIKNQRMNGPLNTHRISEPSLSTKHKNGILKYIKCKDLLYFIQSFIKISPVFPGNFFLKGFTIYEHDKCLGLVTGIMLTNSHFIVPTSLL